MKKRIKTIIYTLIVCSTIMTAIPSVMPMAAQQQGRVVASNVEPRTDIKEWRYKVINGNLYKRLYNYTRNRWEGDWIFVASGVEEL